MDTVAYNVHKVIYRNLAEI